MIEFLSRSADGQHFTLAVGGERRTYPADKVGRRQAILEGLQAIEPVTVDEDVYLASDAVLQVVATVLFPDGIATEEAYRQVGQVAEKACTHLGYGPEVELAPPHVPFSARGAYRKRYSAVDPQLVLAELELAGTSSFYPRREANRRSIWNKAAWEIYGQALNALTEAQQAQIQIQVDAIAAAAGWQPAEDRLNAYTRPLPVNANEARLRVTQYLAEVGGRPVAVRAVTARAQAGAYGRSFYNDELAPELTAVVNAAFEQAGYQPEPRAGEYWPVPVEIGADRAAALREQLAALKTVSTDFGPGLLLQDVLAAVRPMLTVHTISDWQAEQLIQTGPLAHALRQLGYQTETTWCRRYHFRPPLEEHGSYQVLLREIRVQNEPNKTLSLAGGLTVYTPALTVDDEEDVLVYLEMVGPKQSVKATWATLVGGNKVHWLGARRVQLDGMKDHVRIQTTLPCGWANHILLHKQASLKAMNPEQPFYLLDDGAQPIPPLFYPMLNRCLALPLLEGWSEYLWHTGRERKLIRLLDEGFGQGYAAWRVLPAPEEWQQLVQMGLSSNKLLF